MMQGCHINLLIVACAVINVSLLLAAGAQLLCLRHKVTKSQVSKKASLPHRPSPAKRSELGAGTFAPLLIPPPHATSSLCPPLRSWPSSFCPLSAEASLLTGKYLHSFPKSCLAIDTVLLLLPCCILFTRRISARLFYV